MRFQNGGVKADGKSLEWPLVSLVGGPIDVGSYSDSFITYNFI